MTETNRIANAVSEAFDASVFVYSGIIDSKGFGQLIESMQPSEAQPFKPNAFLLLATHGGEAAAAYQIARLFQNTFENFRLCIADICKSAGTLIALGANEIVMTGIAELGPLDVQLVRRDELGQRRSGLVVRTALEGLAEETWKVYSQVMIDITINSRQAISFEVASRIATTIATGVMTPVYAQVDPEALGSDLRNLRVATAYGERLVEHGQNAKQRTVRSLVEDYPSHDFIIDRSEAEKLFNKVTEPTEDVSSLIEELGSVVYSPQRPCYVARLDKCYTMEGGASDDDNRDARPKREKKEGNPKVDDGRQESGKSNTARSRKSRIGTEKDAKTGQNA